MTRPGLTVSAAWGVGGGVGGEATESVVLHPDGSETLVSEAKAAYARRLRPQGGLDMVPARHRIQALHDVISGVMCPILSLVTGRRLI